MTVDDAQWLLDGADDPDSEALVQRVLGHGGVTDHDDPVELAVTPRRGPPSATRPAWGSDG